MSGSVTPLCLQLIYIPSERACINYDVLLYLNPFISHQVNCYRHSCNAPYHHSNCITLTPNFITYYYVSTGGGSEKLTEAEGTLLVIHTLTTPSHTTLTIPSHTTLTTPSHTTLTAPSHNTITPLLTHPIRTYPHTLPIYCTLSLSLTHP